MKKKYIITLFASCFMVLAACQNVPDSAPVPTPTTSLLPTNNPVCTEVPEPTEIPTIPPTETPIPTEEPTPTETPHEHTWIQKETSATCLTGSHIWEECECGEIQNEQFGTEFTHGELVYTVTVEPTEETEGAYMETCILCGTVINQGTLPVLTHEHVWEQKEVAATCTEDGKAWEECKCGAMQNEVVIKEALGHGELTYHVVTEPSLTEEGSYENICQVCKMIVNTGTLPKLTPIPTPTSTPTPKPTSTPTPKPTATPTPSPKPTAVPTKAAEQEKCEHKNWEYIPVMKVHCKDCEYTFNVGDCDHSIETEMTTKLIDGIRYNVLNCNVCTKTIEVYDAILTPTPTPKPPVPTAEPLPPNKEEATAGKTVVETKADTYYHVNDAESCIVTIYDDNTKVVTFDNGDFNIYYQDGSEQRYRKEFTKADIPVGSAYESADGSYEWKVIKAELDEDHYYFYRLCRIYNTDGSLSAKYSVLCNSDGSLNELSDVEYSSFHWGVSDSDGAKAIVIYAFDKTKTDISISISTNRIYTYVADTSNGYKETIIKEYTWEEYYNMVVK